MLTGARKVIKFGRFKRIDARAERGAPVGPCLCRHTTAFDEKGEKAIRTAGSSFRRSSPTPDVRFQRLNSHPFDLYHRASQSAFSRGAGVAVVLRRCGSFAGGLSSVLKSIVTNRSESFHLGKTRWFCVAPVKYC